MKITFRGSWPVNRHWKFVCNRCQSEFDAAENELVLFSKNAAGETGYVQCPVCGGNCASKNSYIVEG